MRRFFSLLFLIAILLSACNAPAAAGETPTPAVDAVATVVALTLEALVTPTPAPSPTPAMTPTPPPPPATPTPEGVSVSGKVCFPRNNSGNIVVYFQNVATNQVIEQVVTAGSSSYSVSIPSGTYQVYMWTQDFALGGLACTPEQGCAGNAVRQIVAQAGVSLANVDLCDWNNGPFDVPYPPGKRPQEVTGSISGVILNYPGGGTPSFTVIFFNQSTGFWYSWQPAPGDTYFQRDGLPPGTYQVVAYDQNNLAGGAVGLVSLSAGQNVTVNITDWSGSYPARP
ncbi:MAG: carboxypeptidase-like regulatory domain-containing protein [Anaerolineales bacterium]